MQKYINSVASSTGAPVGGASVQVNVYPGGTPATIYSDNGITQSANPLTTDLANGSFSFYAPDGHYQLVVTGSNIQPITLNDVLLVDAIPSDQAVASSVNSSDILSIQQGGTLKQATGALVASMVLGADSPIPVANGGTGATTAANARTNLGAAASGANGDITSLTGLTTPLALTEGGTGASTATGARTALGLGSMATQNANSVAITGGTMSGVTLSDLSPNTGASLVGANDGASGSLWTTVAGFIAKIISSVGSSVVGFLQAGTGAVARNVQDRLRERVSVKDFGAVGDGVANDTAAITLALNYINSIANGGTLYFPRGTYIVSAAALPAINNVNVTIVGDSQFNTTIQCVTGGTIFTFNGANNVTVQDLQFSYTGTPATTDLIFQLTNSNHFRFLDLHFVNTSRVAVIGDAAGTNIASGVFFSRCSGYIANISATMITCNRGAGLFVDTCAFFCNSGVPTNNRTSTMTTATNCNWLQFGAFSWDSVQIVNCQLEQFYYGLNVVTGAGVIVNDFYISNTIFDYCSATAVSFSANNPASGGIFGVRLSNVWVASWSGDGVDIIGAGTCQGFTLDSVHCIIAGYNGIQVGGGNQKDIVLDNIWIGAVNRIAGTANGIYIASGTDRITVTNCRGGYDNTPLGFAWQATIGLNAASGTTNMLVSHNHLECISPVNAYLLTTGSSQTGCLVNNNINASSYSGRQSTGIYTTPASGATWTNNAPTIVDVMIYGGAATTITKNGLQVGNTGPATITLAPGETYSVTYSSTPTINYFVKP